MDNIKLSVIIPMFNGRKFIKETVDSLLKIKSKKEILIIDDGSSDNSYDYCIEHWSKIPDIKIYKKKNSGIVDTRNFGMQKAKGKYLLFTDQDDLIYPDTIDKAIKYAEMNSLDGIIWSTVRLIDEEKIVPCDTVHKNQILQQAEIQKVLISEMLTNIDNSYVTYLGHVWAGIYRRDIIEQNNIIFKRFIDIEDDYLFVFDFLRAVSNIGLLDCVGYAWRYNPKSETYRQKYIEEILERYKKFYDYIDDAIEDLEINSKILNKYHIYKVQNTLVMAIENSFTCLNHSSDDKKEIKRFYKDNKEKFKIDSVFNYGKRRKRIYWCLHCGSFFLATIYVYADSIYRKIRKRLTMKFQ